MSDTARANPQIVRVRVLAKGHDRVFTGNYDERALKFTKYETGEEFDIARDIADALVARDFATIVEAASAVPADSTALPKLTGAMPDDPEHRANWSRFARERIAQRAERLPETGCLLWKGAQRAGGDYGTITFLSKTYAAHRFAWLAHRGPIPPGLLVCHSCDNRLCVEPEHLFLGTARQNTIDMISKGRGHLFGNAWRLDTATVANIKRRLQAGESIRNLAEEMKVSVNTIGDIKRGKTWTFVEPA